MFVIAAEPRTNTFVYWEEERDGEKKWVILYSTLNKWMGTCLAHMKNKPRATAKGLSRSVMEWEVLFCHSEGANFRKENRQSVLPFSVTRPAQVIVKSWLSLLLHLASPSECSEGSFRWDCLEAILHVIMKYMLTYWGSNQRFWIAVLMENLGNNLDSSSLNWPQFLPDVIIYYIYLKHKANAKAYLALANSYLKNIFFIRKLEIKKRLHTEFNQWSKYVVFDPFKPTKQLLSCFYNFKPPHLMC